MRAFVIVPEPSWLKATMDPRAAGTVFPENCEYGRQSEEKNHLKVKSAAVEVANSWRDMKLEVWDEWVCKMS